MKDTSYPLSPCRHGNHAECPVELDGAGGQYVARCSCECHDERSE